MKGMRFFASIILILITVLTYAQSSNKILIAAASDLKFSLDSIITAFERNNGDRIDVTYGSSGKLFEQISNGAPYAIFFSADIRYPKQLAEKGLTETEVYPYAIGRIVIWSKKIDPSKDKMEVLRSASIKKIAIANPVHAPYGKRAEEALTHYGLLPSVKPKLVYGENISQTAQFITTGAADIGIVALSLALSPNMKREGGKYYLIPEASHNRLVQGAVITSKGKGNDVATAFMEFIKSEEANTIFTHFGFIKP